VTSDADPDPTDDDPTRAEDPPGDDGGNEDTPDDSGSDREHVVVGYDGTPQSETALAFVCQRHADARVTLLYVINPVAAGYSAEVSLPTAASEWYETERARAEETLTAARETAADRGVDAETAVEVGRPATAIVEYVETADADHVVLGSHGRTGVSRVLLGSVAEGVMRRSPVPVTVVR